MNWRIASVWLASGIVFGAGLSLSGMINPRKVLAFLDVAGQWDPTLLLVMSGAVAVTLISFHFVLKRERPLLGQFDLPTRRDIDTPLVVGASLFGLGWGLVGYCPGPVITAFTVDWREPTIFCLTMVAGIYLRRLIPD